MDSHDPKIERTNWIRVDCGVSQGTVLGPVLFLMFINDQPDCISKERTARLFPDDCIVYRTILTTQDQIEFKKNLDKLQ